MAKPAAAVAGLAGLVLAGWLVTLAQAAPNIVFVITDDQDKLVRTRVALAPFPPMWALLAPQPLASPAPCHADWWCLEHAQAAQVCCSGGHQLHNLHL